MTIKDAYLIKGWLLEKQPPEAITQAIDSVITSLEAPAAEPEPKKRSKRSNGWTPERRERQSELMRARRAKTDGQEVSDESEESAEGEAGAPSSHK